ncbi:ChrB domain-containing protein [Variovorax sp. LjRoot84]
MQSDIEQAGGEAVIFETQAVDAKQEERVVAYFKRDREQDYEEFLEKCDDYKKEIEKEVKAGRYSFAEIKENEDLKKLKNWLERIKIVDFYGAPARARAEQQLVECEALLESYANEVFEREQNTKTAPTRRPATAKRATAKRPAKRDAKP